MKNKTGNKDTQKSEANYIDKIIKENCQNLVPFIVRRIFGVEFDEMKNLPEIKQQVTKEKEPDFLRIIHNQEYSDGAIVQLEFETSDYKKMDKRMLEYLALLHKKTEKPVLQFVLYLGEGQAKMNREIVFGRLDYSFEVINIQDFRYEDFINSTSSEEVILSLLANSDDISEDELLDLIIHRLVQLNGNSLATKKFINQLIMLSRLRNLQYQTIKKVRDMNATIFDVNTDILFIEGKEQGLEQGLEQGKEKGELRKSIVGIQNMTVKEVENDLIAYFLELEVDFVEKIQKQLLKKDKINALLKKKNSDVETIAKKLKVHPILVTILQEDLEKTKKKK